MVANFTSNDPLTTVSQKSPCKVCGWVKKCAVSASERTVLCANSTAQVGDIVGDYKCVRTDNPNSHCSHTFIRGDALSTTTTNKPPKTELPELSTEDRNIYHRQVIAELKLTEPDKKHLLEERGLSEEQIEKWNFRSVIANHPVKGEYPQNLPGYRWDKKQLAISGRGILCPIRQIDEIVAFKVRLTNKRGDQRYTCVSDKNYTQYHIQGEQPLAVLTLAENYSSGVWVAEGNELKPAILHLKYNIPVLGGARYWHSYKIQANKFLPDIKTKSNVIKLCVDAGDVLNSSGIPLKWVKEYKFFESQGFDVSFVWWGQITKESPDIDELEDNPDFEYINLDQFKELVKEHNPDAYKQIEDLEKTPLLTLAVDNTKPSDDPVITFNQKSLKELFDDSHSCVNEKFYQWQGKYHKELDNALVLKRIRDFCNSYAIYVENKDGKVEIKYPFANTKTVNEVFKWAQISLAVSREEFNKTVGINCTNGVLTIDWEHNKPIVKLEPHDPKKHFFTSEPIITYDPKADTKYCDQLLRCLDDKQLQVLLRNLGASLDLPTVRKFKGRLVKILFCIGQGSNGKDSIREVISLIYGSNSVSNFSLNDFTDYDNGNKNSLAGLSKARVNWASESGKTTRIDNSLSLKRFATGDTLTERYLFKDGVDYVPNAIALFNLNELPNLFGTGQAALDRFAPLMFNKSFVKQEDYDPTNPNQELADPRFKYDRDFLINEVAPAFLNYMIKGLQDLMVEGIDYSCTEDALKDIQNENNHLFEAAQDLSWHYDPNAKPIRIGTLYQQLEQWYKDQEILADNGSGYPIWSKPHKPSDRYIKSSRLLLPRLKEIFPKIKVTELRPEGSTKPCPHIVGVSTSTPIPKPVSLPPKQIIFCEAPHYVPPGAMVTTSDIPQNTPNIPQIYPKIPQNKNASNLDISTVSADIYTPNTPNTSKPLEKKSKEDIDPKNSAETSQTISKNSADDDGTVINKERLDDFGVFGVDKNAENLTTQELPPNNFGVYLGDNLGYKSENLGYKSENIPTVGIDELIRRIKVNDPQEQKKQEFKQQQLAEKQAIEGIKSQILNFQSSEEHLDLKRTLEFNDGKVFRTIKGWLQSSIVVKEDGSKEFTILSQEFVEIWLS